MNHYSRILTTLTLAALAGTTAIMACSFDLNLGDRKQYYCESDKDCLQPDYFCDMSLENPICALNVPDSGQDNTKNCVDNDGDQYGEGEDCLGPDCDDDNPYAWTGAIEVCDGIDNNCNGLIDADDTAYEEQYCPLQVGVCNGSTKECPVTLRNNPCYSEDDALGVLKSCEVPCNAERYANHSEHYVTPETAAHCDGKDNDCDGAIDELCVCNEDDTEECGTDVGECELGYRECIGGAWSEECIDSVNPGVEICDGKDNDCDGEVDEETVCGPCDWNEVMVDRPSDNAKFCIDRYEASRRDATAESEGVSTNMLVKPKPSVKPWSNVTFQTAQQICTNKGMELCSAEVWTAACRTGANNMYPYGGNYQEGVCNGAGSHSGTVPTAQMSGCVARWTPRGGNDDTGNIFDMSGNLMEWVAPDVANKAQRHAYGGSYMSSQNELQCTAKRDFTEEGSNATTPEIGFRCCRRLIIQ